MSLIRTRDGWRSLERGIRTPAEATNWRGFEMKICDELAELCPTLGGELIARQAEVFRKAFAARLGAASA